MTKKTLEECASILDEIHTKRKHIERVSIEERKEEEKEIIALEALHKKMVYQLAQNSENLEDILVCLNDENRKISGEAFLVIVESQNKKIIQVVIEKYIYNRAMRQQILSKMGYVSLEAFDVLFWTMKELGFEKTEAYGLITESLIDYISANHLIQYIDSFLEIEKFSLDFQEKIIKSLRYFEEFQKVLIKLYQENHPYFLKETSITDIVWTLLLQKQVIYAFKILRDENHIINSNDIIFMLVRYGNKSDGKLIAEVLKDVIKNKKPIKHQEQDYWLYKKVEEIYQSTVSSPEFLNNILDMFLLSSDDEIGYLLSLMLSTQFGDNKLLTTIENIYEANETVNKQEVYDLWIKHDRSDTRKKYLHNSKVVNIKDFIFSSLAYSESTIRTNDYDDLVISTGEYFPLNLNGYYSDFKQQAQVWLDYLEENKEKFEAGRWIRYGEYVD